MVYLLAPHSSALQTSTMKFRQDFIGPLFIYRYHPRQDELQAERCHQFAIGQYLLHELHQERFSAHTSGHSKYF